MLFLQMHIMAIYSPLVQGWLVSVRGYALTLSSLKPHAHLERVSIVLVGGMDRGQQAMAAASIDSRVQ